MGALYENILKIKESLNEAPKGFIEIPVTAKLEYETKTDSWWFAFYTKDSAFALGGGDLYQLPDHLRREMKLDSLITQQTAETKIDQGLSESIEAYAALDDNSREAYHRVLNFIKVQTKSLNDTEVSQLHDALKEWFGKLL